METIDLFGRPVHYKRCQTSDLNTHFEKIQDVVTDMPHVEFLERMNACVKEDRAYALEDDSCFLYYLPQHFKVGEPRTAHGIAMYGPGNSLGMIALLRGIFEDNEKSVTRIDFKLHPGKIMKEYRSFLLTATMQRYGVTDRPLFVRVDMMRERLRELYAKRGLYERSS